MSEVSLDALRDMPWWGAFKVHDEQVSTWRIGALRIWVTTKPGEWRVHYDQGDDPLDEHALHGTLEDPVPEGAKSMHIASEDTTKGLVVVPQLADRDVVARPEIATVVVRGDTAAFWVTTPVWVRIEAADGACLLDVPTFRPSDTWFGDPTDGELCYASRVAAYTHISRLKFRAARATTRVTVRNHNSVNLTLERLRLPAPSLSLYVDGNGNFWTQDVTITVGQDAPAQISVSSEPPDVEDVRLVQGPRRPSSGNLIVRALSRWLS